MAELNSSLNDSERQIYLPAGVSNDVGSVLKYLVPEHSTFRTRA